MGVPANADAVGTLVRTNIKDMHPKLFWMEDEDLDELYEDVVDNLQRALRHSSVKENRHLESRLQECVTAMRTLGDAYCKELWQQEDFGQRRRRREESDDDSDDSKKSAESRGPMEALPATDVANDNVPLFKKVR